MPWIEAGLVAVLATLNARIYNGQQQSCPEPQRPYRPQILALKRTAARLESTRAVSSVAVAVTGSSCGPGIGRKCVGNPVGLR